MAPEFPFVKPYILSEFVLEVKVKYAVLCGSERNTAEFTTCWNEMVLDLPN